MKHLGKFICVSMCIFFAGCGVSSYTSTPHYNSTPTYLNNYQPQQIEQPKKEKKVEQPKQEKKYDYPLKLSKFKPIYKMLNIQKDEFTTTSEHNEKISKKVSSIHKNGDLIFKIKNYRKYEQPPMEYNADTGLATVHFYVISTDLIKNNYGIVTNEYSTTKEKIGQTAFGVTASYSETKGYRNAIRCTNIPFLEETACTWHGKIQFKISPTEAKSLKKNLESFIVVEIDDKNGDDIATTSFSGSIATLDSPVQIYYDIYALKCKAKAILICNKKTKKVVHTEYY